MPAKASDPKVQALLELERREMQQPGTMPEALKAQLQAYRQQGVIKPLKAETLTETQTKDAAFLSRVLASEKDFQSSGFQDKPRGNASTFATSILPGGITNQFDATGRQLSENARKDFISASLRLESGAAIGPDEFKRQNEIFFPQVGDGPEVIAQKARHRQAVIDGFRIGAGPGAADVDANIARLYPDKKKEAGAVSGAPSVTIPDTPPPAGGPPPIAGFDATRPNAKPDDGSGGGTPTIESTPTNHPFSTDADKHFTTLVQSAFNNGASRKQLDDLAVKYGYKPFGADLDTALDYRNRGGKGAQIAAPQAGMTNPSAAQKLIGTAAASPAGAAVIGAGNGLTLGGGDEIGGAVNSLITGKPLDESIADFNMRKGLVRDTNPGMFTAGEIGGGILTSLAGSQVAGVRAAVGALAPRALALDGAIGATYGGLENNEDRTTGAITGALTSVAGGALGRGAVNRVAGAISPNVNPDVAFLRSKGVRTTPGQSIGPTASRLEEKMISVPGLGDLIRNGRERALGDFNRAYLDDTLGHIGDKLPDGASGTKAMAYAQGAFDKAYDKARAGMQLIPDSQLATDIQALDARLAGGEVSDEVYKRVGKIYDAQVLRRIRNGTVSGDDYKTMMSQLGKMQDSAKRAQNTELSDALSEVRGVLDDAARRASPPDAVAAMDAADTGYAKFVRAEKAAAMRGGDTAMFTPAALDSAVQKLDSSVRSKAYLRGDALGQEWATAGKNILRDVVPNSGTMDRFAAGGLASGLATGAGYLNPATLAVPAGLTAAYLPGVRDVLSSAVVGNRGAGLKTAADSIRDRAFIGSTVASPLALMYQQQ